MSNEKNDIGTLETEILRVNTVEKIGDLSSDQNGLFFGDQSLISEKMPEGDEISSDLHFIEQNEN